KWRIITFSTLAENEQSEISNSQFLKEKELDITFFNDSMCQILGYSKEELMGVNNRRYADKPRRCPRGQRRCAAWWPVSS
ncbi:MAG: PAS domain-containing protein, partial [Smithella sp.]|nr:PAS domain-containing protein [Smithella sp.]